MAHTLRLVLAILTGTLACAGSTSDPNEADDAAFRTDHYTKQVMRIPMRDGIKLFTIAYIPRDAGVNKSYPIILNRTPFSVGSEDKSILPPSIAPDRFTLRDGYIFVHQEVRGRYRSGGSFVNVRPSLNGGAAPATNLSMDAAPGGSATTLPADEVTDAYDTIEWLVHNLPGNSGRVGLYGVSYGGYYAALGAASRHKSIVALVLHAPVADFWFEDFHQNGAFALSSLFGIPVLGASRAAPTAENWWLPAFSRVPQTVMTDDYRFLLKSGSLTSLTTQWFHDNPWWADIVEHPDYDSFWRERALLPRMAGLSIPVLLVGGWLDAQNLYGTLAVQRELQASSPGSTTRFVMGPFGHRQWLDSNAPHTMHGHIYFGDSLSTQVQRDENAAFLRATLKQDGPALSGVRVFDTGRKRWDAFASWPVAGTRMRTLRLGDDGAAHFDTSSSSSSSADDGAERFKSWTSDPANPIPSRCTGSTVEDGSPNIVMSDDQRCVSNRSDVVSFQTAPLENDLTVSGAIAARLGFSTTGTDADLIVKVIDILPDGTNDNPYKADTSVHMAGYQQLVRAQVVRARYRNSNTVPSPLIPDSITAINVMLADVHHTFLRGHRLMVQIQSSWFPFIDRNPQRFVGNIYKAMDGDFVSAEHKIWLGGVRGSVLQIPILEGRPAGH